MRPELREEYIVIVDQRNSREDARRHVGIHCIQHLSRDKYTTMHPATVIHLTGAVEIDYIRSDIVLVDRLPQASFYQLMKYLREYERRAEQSGWNDEVTLESLE